MSNVTGPEACFTTARAADRVGICAIPPAEDGTKKPLGVWKHWQKQRPTLEQHCRWYQEQKRSGIFYVCGRVSGNLEMLECESMQVYDAFKAAAYDANLGELVERIEAGYFDATPGGGGHLLYRCPEGISGNTILARQPKPPEERRDDKDLVQVLIETRGEGGGAVSSPSNGKVHPSGGAYRLVRGGLDTIATITPEEREDLFDLARTFDAMPRQNANEPPRGPQGDGTRPGDDYNERGDIVELLERHDWSVVYSRGDVTYLRRPGKSQGVSGSVGYKGTRYFYPFSSSTVFEAMRAYSPFSVYSILEHGKDFRVAAKALAAEGYGKRQQQSHQSHTNDQETDDQTNDQRPVIDVTDQDLQRISQKAWAAIQRANDPPTLLTFGPIPVRITKVDGTPTTQNLTEDRLRHVLARIASWVKETKEGGVRATAPPVPMVRDMLAAPSYPLPSLVGIVEVPTFGPDGSLPAGPGYHAASRTYYAPADGFVVPPIPLDPSEEEIQQARSLICDDLLTDFPFTGDAERANAVALLLLPFVRGMIAGPTPLHLIEKPSAGTGATLLAEIVALIATGRSIGAMTEGRDEDEWRKRITAKLRGAPSIVLIDNLRRRLDSAVVSSVLTTQHLEDRLLGTSDNVRLPVRCAWIATGNNPAFSSEITRRTIRIRLDAKRDRPWLREGFKHDPLLKWAEVERAQIVAGCLTLVRAWIVAGRPTPADSPVLGSFEAWSRTLAGILDVAGIPGFLGNLSAFYEVSDTEGTGIRSFLASWWEKHQGAAVGVAQLFPIAVADESGIDLGDKGERSQKIRLGRLLGELRDRHYQITDTLTVCVTPDRIEHKSQLWKLVSTPWGDVGDVGDVSQPNAGEKPEDPYEEYANDIGGTPPPYPPHPPDDDAGGASANEHDEGVI